MDFGIGSYATGLLAGSLSILSPCVLPAVPIGARLGLDTDLLRTIGAILLATLGFALIATRGQQAFATATAGIGSAGNGLLDRWRFDGLTGQFATGLLLGMVWSPWVGPTLGAAIMLASRGSHLPQIALLMAVFGIGVARRDTGDRQRRQDRDGDRDDRPGRAGPDAG